LNGNNKQEDYIKKKKKISVKWNCSSRHKSDNWPFILENKSSKVDIIDEMEPHSTDELDD